MESRKFILHKTAVITAGELICSGAMVCVFTLLGYFDYTVILGALLGSILAIGNFFFMAIASDAAADKAQQQDVKGGKAAMKASYRYRIIIIGVLLFLFAKSGHCNVLALVCPLFFTFPILMVTEFFRKAGESKA